MRLFAHHPQTNEPTLRAASKPPTKTSTRASTTTSSKTQRTKSQRQRVDGAFFVYGRVNNHPLILQRSQRLGSAVEIDFQKLSVDPARMLVELSTLLTKLKTLRGSQHPEISETARKVVKKKTPTLPVELSPDGFRRKQALRSAVSFLAEESNSSSTACGTFVYSLRFCGLLKCTIAVFAPPKDFPWTQYTPPQIPKSPDNSCNAHTLFISSLIVRPSYTTIHSFFSRHSDSPEYSVVAFGVFGVLGRSEHASPSK